MKTKILCLSIIFLGLFGFVQISQAERFFQQHNTWYETISNSPGDDPISAGKITEYRNTIDGGAIKITLNKEWGPNVWRATENTPTVDIRNYYCTLSATHEKCTLPRQWEPLGWGLNVPIPTGAIPAQNNEKLACFPSYCTDAKTIVISADGKTAWDFGYATYYPTNWGQNSTCTGVGAPFACCAGANLWNNTGACLTSKSFAGKWATVYLKKWDLTGEGVNYPYDNNNGPTEAKVPLLHGLITYDEVVKEGVINHAVAMSAHMWCNAAHQAIYPSGIFISSYTDFSNSVNCLKGGERFYLDSSFNCETMSTTYPMDRIVCRALKTYGGILMEIDGHGYNGIYLQNSYGQSWSWSGIAPYHAGIPTDKLKISLPIYPSSTPPPPPPADTPPAAPSGLQVQ